MTLLPILRATLIAMNFMAANASAHEGHDHGDQTKTLAVVGTTPRLEAVSGPFELVALLQSGELVIYLDRFETNEPLLGAQVVVETPAGQLSAPLKGGAYRLAAPWAPQTGSLDLIFTVTADDHTEILSGTLELNAAPNEVARGGWSLLSPAMAQGLKETLRAGSTLVAVVLAFCAGVAATLLLRRGNKPLLLLVVAGALVLSPGIARAHEGEDHGDAPRAALTSDLAQRLTDGVAVRAQAGAAHSRHSHRGRKGLNPHQNHRTAGPDHPGPERERPGASLRQWPPVAARRGLPPSRYGREGRRRAGLCDAAVPGH